MLLISINTFAGISGDGVHTDYTATNVGTTNWVVLIPNTQLVASSINIFDTSGQLMEIGIADYGSAANTEVRQFLVPPGGVDVKLFIPRGKRISIRAVLIAATSGVDEFNVLY